MAELHVIGELVGAQGFPSASLFCRCGYCWVRSLGICFLLSKVHFCLYFFLRVFIIIIQSIIRWNKATFIPCRYFHSVLGGALSPVHRGSAWRATRTGRRTSTRHLTTQTRAGATLLVRPSKHRCHRIIHVADVHYATRSMQGWPKLHVEVWHQDDYARNELGTFINQPSIDQLP